MKKLGVPGASNIGEDDPWEVLLREFVISNSQLDLKSRELISISPKLWENYSQLTFLDLSQNPKLGEVGIPAEFAQMRHLKTLRLQQCGLKELPVEILSAFKDL